LNDEKLCHQPKQTMKRILTALGLLTLGLGLLNAQVYINEALVNSPGGDSTVTVGFESFELRGTPGMSLAGYYLLSIEGQGTTGRGDINQFIDLGAFTFGANGFLFGQQFGSPYNPVTLGATVVSNGIGQGWGQVNGGGSTAGHSSDAAQLDLENSATTLLLINIGSGSAPTLTTDVDSGTGDGLLDLPLGWTVVDSVGIMDGVTPLATDFSYGAITFRLGGVGSSSYGNIIDVPAGTGTGFYVARKGDSTGSTADDWFGAVLNGSAGNFSVTSASDSFYVGKTVSDMVFGGTNPAPVPEPASISFMSLGLLGLWIAGHNRKARVS
jgi:hypothetical protein